MPYLQRYTKKFKARLWATPSLEDKNYYTGLNSVDLKIIANRSVNSALRLA
jgi:hypothetical protein